MERKGSREQSIKCLCRLNAPVPASVKRNRTCRRSPPTPISLQRSLTPLLQPAILLKIHLVAFAVVAYPSDKPRFALHKKTFHLCADRFDRVLVAGRYIIPDHIRFSRRVGTSQAFSNKIAGQWEIAPQCSHFAGQWEIAPQCSHFAGQFPIAPQFSLCLRPVFQKSQAQYGHIS